MLCIYAKKLLGVDRQCFLNTCLGCQLFIPRDLITPEESFTSHKRDETGNPLPLPLPPCRYLPQPNHSLCSRWEWRPPGDTNISQYPHWGRAVGKLTGVEHHSHCISAVAFVSSASEPAGTVQEFDSLFSAEQPHCGNSQRSGTMGLRPDQALL